MERGEEKREESEEERDWYVRIDIPHRDGRKIFKKSLSTSPPHLASKIRRAVNGDETFVRDVLKAICIDPAPTFDKPVQLNQHTLLSNSDRNSKIDPNFMHPLIALINLYAKLCHQVLHESSTNGYQA